jgi:hypothetical protein
MGKGQDNVKAQGALLIFPGPIKADETFFSRGGTFTRKGGACNGSSLSTVKLGLGVDVRGNNRYWH